MPITEIVAAISVAGCLLLLTAQMVRLRKRHRMDVVGTPPVPPLSFFAAKLALAASIVCLIVRSVTGPAPPSVAARAAFFLLFLGGTAVLSLAFRHLGTNLRMGLPNETTNLVNTGIYRHSRNPIYLGAFAIMGASLIYAFSYVNLAAVVLAVLLHHRIVLSEERFLSKRFPEYESYRRAVRRYL